MYLKSIEVQGFKSFANKMTFEFHNGITAIVGPNGSGKSNVADAVRWVLGEQSAKQLRGARMEDVIFSGTQLRKPQGFAYVAITINNEDKKLNVPYEEVTIARRVYRSGESEYLLNGTNCRLRDVQELLFDTGIGKEGYSIIGQGQIDRIVSGKPEERRELFDEAAGIVKYKKRKVRAEKELEEEQQNLVRIEDILGELEKQIGPLEKQSQLAKEYLMYRDELRILDVNMFLMEYDRIQKEIEEVNKKHHIAAEDLEGTKTNYEETKTEYEKLEKTIEQQEVLLEQSRQKIADDRIRGKQLDGDIKVFEEQIRASRQSETHYSDRVAYVNTSIAESKVELEKYYAQKQETDEKMDKLDDVATGKETQLKQIGIEIAEYERQMNVCNTEIIEFLNQNSLVKTDEQRYETMLEQNNVKRAELTQKILKNKSQSAVLEEAIAAEGKSLKDFSDKLLAMQDNNEELRSTLQKVNADIESCTKEVRECERQYHMENSRLQSLKNMAERYEGYGQSIKRIMEQKKQYPGIKGVVADLIRVKKQYEVAVETALGGSIQNIVTDNENTAKGLIQFLKKNRFGRATFLPLTSIQPYNKQDAALLKEEGVIGYASSLVETEKEYELLAQYLLGRFVVMDNIDHAIALAKKYRHSIRIVTVEGELLNPGGSMSGGAYKNSSNLLGRRREMEDIEAGMQKAKDRLKEWETKREGFVAERDKYTKQMQDNESIIKELSLKQNTAKLKYDRAVADKEENEKKLEQIRLDGKEIDEQKTSLLESIKKLQEQLAYNEEKSKKNEASVEELTKKLDEKRGEEETIREQVAGLRIDFTALEQNNQFAMENIKRVREDLEHMEKELAQLEDSRGQASAQIKEKEEEILSVKKQIETLESEVAELDNFIIELTKKREEITKEHKGFFTKREELSERMNNLDKECFRLESQREKLEESLNRSGNYMWEQYELTYNTAAKLKTDTEDSLPQMRKQADALKGKIRGLGNVNVNAIEEYKNVVERYEQMKVQHDDLIEAEKVLEGIILELDEQMRKQFAEKFSEINERFNAVFKELFGGGKGTLELTEDEDILEAGIRIVAQPPGKKLQNMMQLSGGEKALSAISLLFAIQSLKPSPFCLLDEIEAALDDSNVTRYAKYLHKLTKDTQFIVITHRRGTMASADILYGITMQEKGVSTLVSVNLLDEKDIK